MTSPLSWNQSWTAALVNHLWQSTVVTAAVAWLALALRNNQARVRYWLWMIASLKFLVPFSLLMAVGEWLRSALSSPLQRPALGAVMGDFAQPFQGVPASSVVVSVSASAAAVRPNSDLLPWLLLGASLCGSLAIACRWTLRWWRVRGLVQASSALMLLADVPVLSSPSLLEPGVFGIVRPVLVLPNGIRERLSQSQLVTILAHELCHVRRRDNLTAALHMFVEALFWFHPAVWWIRTRLMEERERACDEAVLQSGSEAGVYAESILNVCRFYVESPLACVPGVTGSDLKQRIARIMAEQVAHKLTFRRKLLLGVAGAVVVLLPVGSGLVPVRQVRAQTTTDTLADTWQGTLHAGKDLRTVLKITKAEGGGYKAVFYSIDQGGDGIPVTKITLDGSAVKMSITAIGGTYDGKLSPDGRSMVGTWSQGGNPLPLSFTRATPETEWTIPAPTPRLPPMDANASPSFEVATIKPSKPEEQGKAFLVRGRRFQIVNMNLAEILSFAYGVHAKQIIGAPAWVNTDKYDFDAQPDGEGAPSDRQWKGMLQKLLAERYKLTFHHDKRELSVYVLAIAKGGPKLTKSEGDPNGLPGLFFRELGALNVRNANMADFASLMQNAVLDRPVVDQTGLSGRFDFTLNWTPDDSQFGGMGAKIPPSTDNSKAPPALYTAIQEQIGLRLDATKAPADVLVIDHVEKPSEN